MNWAIALPEIALSVVAMAILIFGVLRRDDTFFLSSMFALGGFLLAALLVLTSSRGVGYHGQFVADAFSSFVKILVLAGAALALILSLDYNRKNHIARFEYPVLMLLSVTGMMVMASAANLMTLYLGLELQSLALYVLAAFARDDVRSSEAGLKYFVLGALASGLLLYGISLVYGFSGTMDFAALARTLMRPENASPGLIVGIVFVLVGLAFKISAVPFHMWTPDVYEGSPTSVTVFFSTAPKVAAFALLLRTMATPFGHLLIAWQDLIVLMSIASMILGSLAAIGQRNIKRLMAYSSIGHMGYALIGLAVGTPEGIRGVLIYLIVYVFMSAGTFACIIAMQPARSLAGADLRPQRSCPDRSGAGAGDGRLHVLDGRHPAAFRLLRQALRVPCRCADRHVDARHHRCADFRDGGLLLSARRQGDVFRCTGGAVRSAPGVAVLCRRGHRAVHHVLLRLPRAVRWRGAGGGESAVWLMICHCTARGDEPATVGIARPCFSS